nr:MAG TPA: hypothetical protein [Caudoviricetes sp.]
MYILKVRIYFEFHCIKLERLLYCLTSNLQKQYRILGVKIQNSMYFS